MSWSRTSRSAAWPDTASTTPACPPLNPRLVYCSITGFGQTGPRASPAGYDYMIQAMGGLMSVTGQPDGAPGAEPMKVGVAVVDLFTGLYASNAILAALLHARATGQGQHIDIALFDVQAAMLANQATNYFVSGVAPTRMGNAHPNLVPYQPFPCSDGMVVIAVGNDGQFRTLCGGAGRRRPGDRSPLPDQRPAHRAPRRAGRRALGPHLRLDHGRADGAAGARRRALRPRQHHRPGLRRAPGETSRAGDRTGAGRPVRRRRKTVASPIRLSETPVRYDRAPPGLGQDAPRMGREMINPVRL